MNRRTFVQSLVSVLAFLGFSRPVEAQPAKTASWQVYCEHDRASYRLIARLGRHREYNCLLTYEPQDTLHTIQGKFTNLRQTLLKCVEGDGYDTRELKKLIDQGLFIARPSGILSAPYVPGKWMKG